MCIFFLLDFSQIPGFLVCLINITHISPNTKKTIILMKISLAIFLFIKVDNFQGKGYRLIF